MRLSERERQFLTHVDQAVNVTTESVSKALGWGHDETILMAEQLARNGYVRLSDQFSGRGVRITPRGTEALTP